MKKIKFTYLMIMMVILFTLPAFAKNYNIPRFVDTPVIDGSLSLNEQNQALQIDMSYPEILNFPNVGTLENGANAPVDGNDLSAVWYLSWDDTSLYVACRVYDSDLEWLAAYPGRYNTQDTVQLCFNFKDKTDNDFAWLDGIFDLTAETSDTHGPDFYSAVSYLDSARLIMGGQVLADGYIVEALIPWSSFESTFVAHTGDVHGLGLLLVDYDNGAKTILTDFGNGSWTLPQVDTWNTITLVDLGNCGTGQMSAADLNYDCSIDLKDIAILAQTWGDCTEPSDNSCFQMFELINDNTFQYGCKLLDPNTASPIDTLKWNNTGTIVWDIAQWNTNFNFINRTHTLLPSGAHSYTDASKTLILGPVNTDDAHIVIGLDSRPEYGGVYRQSGEPWPAFLLNQRLRSHPWLSDISSLKFHVRVKLLDAGRVETAGYDPGLHTAQSSIYFTVQNLNTASAGYGDLMWFGIHIYDDRYDDIIPTTIMHDAGTGKLIYNLSSDHYTNGLIKNGGWVTYKADIYPLILAGLQEAWSRGYLLDSTDIADYSIGGMNMGLEVPGINWATLQFEDLSLTATVSN